jgi:hypothetical protein
MKTTKREIAKLAFMKLRYEDKYQEAARLANALLFSNDIVLSIGDMDTEIENSIRHCAGDIDKLFAYTYPHNNLRFTFDTEIEISEEQNEKNYKEFFE